MDWERLMKCFHFPCGAKICFWKFLYPVNFGFLVRHSSPLEVEFSLFYHLIQWGFMRATQLNTVCFYATTTVASRDDGWITITSWLLHKMLLLLWFLMGTTHWWWVFLRKCFLGSILALSPRGHGKNGSAQVAFSWEIPQHEKMSFLVAN